jgi:pyruvate kinase
VLEQLAKKGMPARAEISDVSLGKQAQCVMLNKGAHIVEAVRMLASLLENEEVQSLHRWEAVTHDKELPHLFALLNEEE